MGQIKNIKLHIVTDIKVHIENKIPSSIWSQENGYSCCPLQTRCRSHQGQRKTFGSRRTSDLEDEGPRTSPHRRKGTFCRYRHQSECERRWAGCTDVCDSSSDLEGNRRLLPEVC